MKCSRVLCGNLTLSLLQTKQLTTNDDQCNEFDRELEFYVFDWISVFPPDSRGEC